MTGGYAHPGSIQTTVGRILGHIDLNIEQQDMSGMWNFVRQLQTACRVYMEKGDEWNALKGLKVPVKLDERGNEKWEPDAFDNMMEREYLCLKALHEAKIYGYGTPEMGTADGLVTP